MIKNFFRIAALLCLVMVVVGTLFYLYRRSQPEKIIHQTVAPVTMDIIKKTVASGSVMPRKEIEIKSQISGVIDQLPVESGDMVQKGNVLAKIKLIPSMLRVNDAETRLKKSRIMLEDALQTHERVKKRYEQAVSKGEINLKKESPHLLKLNQADLELNTARLNLTDAEKDYQRQKELFDQSIIPATDFQDSQLQLDRTKEAYSKALQNYRMLKAETLDITETELQSAQINLKATKEEFAAAENNLQLISEGNFALSPEKSNTLVRSTIDGMVLDIPVKEGSPVVETSTQSSGTTIAIVADMSDMVFEGYVDESEINKITIGMPLILTIGAIENATFNAVIEHIAPKGSEQSGTIQFRIRAKVDLDEQYFIRAGYSAGADIVLDQKQGVLAIEEGNLSFEKSGVFAEVEIASNKFEKRKIETGLSDGIFIEVRSGLGEDEKVKVRK